MDFMRMPGGIDAASMYSMDAYAAYPSGADSWNAVVRSGQYAGGPQSARMMENPDMSRMHPSLQSARMSANSEFANRMYSDLTSTGRLMPEAEFTARMNPTMAVLHPAAQVHRELAGYPPNVTAASYPPQSTYRSTAPNSYPASIPQPLPSMVTSIGRTPPICKLTVGLLATYKHINKVYYERNPEKTKVKAPVVATSSAPSSRKAATAPTEGCDDKHGDLIIREGDVICDRFQLGKVIGKGSFGQVVQAFDLQSSQMTALKIIKGKKAFFQQAQTEIEILQHLNRKDPDDKFGVVRMKEHFVYKGHQCIVFELLSQNLYDIIRRTKYKGIKISQVRVIGWQIIRCLHYLSSLDVSVIHCDLKPENVLLCHPSSNSIKIIDFGSSCYKDKKMFTYIQSRFYRSPEVMLGLEYDTSIDSWSVGCILVELVTGEPLFGGLDAFDQMYRICLTLGLPPLSMLKRSPKSSSFFDSDSSGQRFVLRSPSNSTTRELKSRSLQQILGLDGSSTPSWFTDKACTPAELLQFCDLIQSLLIFEPSSRIRPADALQHPFFHPAKRTEASTSTAAAMTRQRGGASSTLMDESCSEPAYTTSRNVAPIPQDTYHSQSSIIPNADFSTIRGYATTTALPDALVGLARTAVPQGQLTGRIQMNARRVPETTYAYPEGTEHAAKRKKGSGG